MSAGQGVLNRMSMFKKLMVINVLCLLLACASVSTVQILHTYRTLRENSRYQSEQEMAEIVNGFTKALNQQYATLVELVNYRPLTEYLDARYGDAYTAYLSFNNSVGDWLDWLRLSVTWMNLRIYMDDTYQSVSSLTGGKLSQLQSLSWYGPGGAARSGMQTACAHTVVEGVYQDALVYYQNVWDGARTRVKRVVSVAQSSKRLRGEIRVEAGTLYYLVDPQGAVVSANENCAGGGVRFR